MSRKKEENGKRAEFLIEAYKVRTDLFSAHANRAWARFNILMTVEIALVGLFLTFWIERGFSAPLFWLSSIPGICISLVWYILGAEDRYAYLGFRDRAQAAEEVAAREAGVEDLLRLDAGTRRHGFTAWRLEPISLSKLLAIFPVLFLLVWAFLLLFGIASALAWVLLQFL